MKISAITIQKVQILKLEMDFCFDIVLLLFDAIFIQSKNPNIILNRIN